MRVEDSFMKKSIYINSLFIFLLFSYSTVFAQITYFGDGFNKKEILILNNDNTFNYKSLQRSCYDDDAGLIEIFGNFNNDLDAIFLNPQKIIKSRIKFSNDSLDIKSDSLNIQKKIISSKNYSKEDKFQSKFNILRYKNYEMLVENDDFGAVYQSLEDEYLEFTRLVDIDDEYLNYYMRSKLHIVKNRNYTKKDFINSIPKNFKKYFHIKPITANVLYFTEEKHRDPNIIESVPDDLAMLYNHKITINKGKEDGLFPKMRLFAQKDMKNCWKEFTILTTNQNTSVVELLTDRKCKLEGNILRTNPKK